MSTLERTSSSSLAEQSGALRAGQWGAIDKETYRPYDLERGVEIPLFQGLVVGVAVATPVIVVLWLLSTWRVALAGGALAGSVALAWVTIQGVTYARTALESSEYWQSEALSMGQQMQRETVEHATVRVEVVEQNGAYPRYQFDDLPVQSLEMLRRVAALEGVSKRTVMELGIGDTEAMRLVAALEERGYAQRAAANTPATWTARGLALRRAVGGGGGGGGAGGGAGLALSAGGGGEE